MALQTSGQIKLSEIAAEFGDTAPHALSEFYGKGNAPASGEIELATDFYGASASFFDYQIDGSLRFNDDDLTYLTFSPASTGNRRTWTWSAWLKLASTAVETGDNYIFTSRWNDGTNRQVTLEIKDNRIGIELVTGGSYSASVASSAKLRDPSAWYHIVFAMDTTQATSSNRIKIYINGVQQTDLTGINVGLSYPSQNFDTAFNVSSREMRLGAGSTADANNFDGYMAEINFIDGQALTPTSFGETKSGVWIPKEYTGSYGTNGFHLEFAGNANDSSGNSNNWTANNISSYDYVPDSPTNNFDTINPLARRDASGSASDQYTLAQGNLQPTFNNSFFGSIQVSSGKWYWECRRGSGLAMLAGFKNADNKQWITTNGQGVIYAADSGTLWMNGTNYSYGATWGAGDIIGCAIDIDGSSVTFYKNGVSQGTRTANFPTNITNWIAGGNSGNATNDCICNFGQDSTFLGNTTAGGNSDANGYGDFKYSVPSGYLALCTANLPVAEGVDPAEDNSPQDYFNTVLYTGNGTSQTITGVGFQPDWVWQKIRSQAYDHRLYDAVRGATKHLRSNSTGSEITNTQGITAFTSDGFTVGNDLNENQSGQTMVAWNWKANGSGVSNSEGTNTVTLSASPESGFSIATANTTIGNFGHGLDQAPEVVITKSKNSTGNWHTWFELLGTGTSQKYIYINSNNGAAGPDNYEYVAVNSTTVTLQGSSAFNNPIVYMFHSVDGFSKFGSYTGNGSTDGAFVYTGFSPAMVIIKRYDSSGNWYIFDVARGEDKYLLPHTLGSEGTYDYWDIVSNGFKLRWGGTSENANGGQYLYMAFAENPFKYATAR